MHEPFSKIYTFTVERAFLSLFRRQRKICIILSRVHWGKLTVLVNIWIQWLKILIKDRLYGYSERIHWQLVISENPVIGPHTSARTMCKRHHEDVRAYVRVMCVCVLGCANSLNEGNFNAGIASVSDSGIKFHKHFARDYHPIYYGTRRSFITS